MGCLYQMGYNPFKSFYAGILRDTLHQETGPTATTKAVLILLWIIGKRGLFNEGKVKVSLFLAMLEISGNAVLELFSEELRLCGLQKSGGLYNVDGPT
jgi:hypothetical protein